MAKDPAFLFYPNDWIGGTMGMTFEEKGAYIELLMMQFNRGHMTSHMIGQTVGQLWDSVKDKFVQDNNGLWYNKRLELEQQKRKTFTESRRNNIRGHNQYSKKDGKKVSHMTSHMENENENENENRDTKEKEGVEGRGESPLRNPDAYIVPRMVTTWQKVFPKYLLRQENDFPALKEIAFSICDYLAKPKDFSDKTVNDAILQMWSELVEHIAANDHYSKYSLSQVHKYIQSILQSYNRPKAPEKSGLQYLYERYCEDGKIDPGLISEQHYRQLFEKGMVKVDKVLIGNVKKNRINALTGSNKASDLRLLEAYQQHMQGKIETHPLLDEDDKLIELHAKRRAVIGFFKKQREGKVHNLLPTNKTA